MSLFANLDLRDILDPPRRRVTHREMQVLALRARDAGPGSYEQAEYERAVVDVEAQRQDIISEELSQYDETQDHNVSMHLVERMIRCTVALTLEECEHPAPDATPSTLERRIATACDLIALLERIEDFRHDFLMTGTDARMRELQDLFQDQMRKQAMRMENRKRLDMILPNVFKRFSEEFRAARCLEKELRASIKDYQFGADIRYDTRRFDEPVSTAFTCALALEAHFEDRVFADDVATQGAR